MNTPQEAPTVTLYDHFDDYTSLRIANIQPQYGLVQLNSTFKDQMVSVDVKVADLVEALDRLGFLDDLRAAVTDRG